MISKKLCVLLLISCGCIYPGCAIRLRLPGIGIGIGNDPRAVPAELEVGGLRVLDHRVNIVVSRTMASKATVETRRLVSSPLGVMVGQRATMTFDPRTEELVLVEAYMEHQDGTRIPVQEDNVFTRPSEAAQASPGFVHSQTMTVIFPQLQVGSQTYVKWRFRDKSRPLLGFNFLYRPELAVPVDTATITISHPTALPVHYRERGGFEVVKLDGPVHGKTSVFQARLTDFRGHAREPAMVSAADVVPLFVATSTESWEEVGRLFHTGFLGRTEVTPDIHAVAHRVARSRTGLEAARRLHRWVARNVHYVSVRLKSMDSWAPHSAARVLGNGYGDCKDQIALLAALLRARGISSEPVLINIDRSFEPLPLATPLAFDHCILYLPEFDVYADPTNPYADLGELLQPLSGKFVVHATETGRTGRTPVADPKDSRYAVFHNLTIGPQGEVSGQTTMQMEGRPEIRLREILARSTSGAALADSLLLSTPEGGAGQISSSDPTDLGEPLRCEATWTSPHALSMGDKVFFATPVGVDLANPATIRQYISPETRDFPIVASALALSWTCKMRLPEGYVAEVLPGSRRLENAAGSFVAEYTGEGSGNVFVTRRLLIQKDVFGADEYPDLRDLLYEAVNDARRVLVMSRATP